MRYRFRHCMPFELGDNSFEYGLCKKYKHIVYNAYLDDSVQKEYYMKNKTISKNGAPLKVTFEFEVGPREFKLSGYPHFVTLEYMLWMKIESYENPLLVACSTKGTYSGYYLNRMIREFETIAKFTAGHPAVIDFFGSKPVVHSHVDYQQFLYQIWNTLASTKREETPKQNLGAYFLQAVSNYKTREKKRIEKLAADNKWTKKQINEYKKEEKDKILTIVEEQKAVEHAMKEMDMIGTLSIHLATLIDEAKDMQDFIANPDNKLNVAHYKSRVNKVKGIVDTLRKIKNEK